MQDAFFYGNTIIQDIYAPCEGKLAPWDEKLEKKFKWLDKGIASIKPSGNYVYAPCNGIITSSYVNGITLVSDLGIKIEIEVFSSKLISEQFTDNLIEKGMRVDCHQPIMILNKKPYHLDCLVALAYHKDILFFTTNKNLEVMGFNCQLLKIGKINPQEKIVQFDAQLEAYKLKYLEKAAEGKEFIGPATRLYLKKEFEDILK